MRPPGAGVGERALARRRAPPLHPDVVAGLSMAAGTGGRIFPETPKASAPGYEGLGRGRWHASSKV